MSTAVALGRDLNELTAEVRSHREDIVFLTAARFANPQAADRAIETLKAKILQAEERIQALRLEALRISGDRCVD
jgi:hypothetical protein